MDTLQANSYEIVLKTVRQWPQDRRFALVRDVINTLAAEVFPSRPRRKTLERALGLLATSQPAPSGAEIQQWLGERRMEKYG
jgi:dihydroneopterin aldolase